MEPVLTALTTGEATVTPTAPTTITGGEDVDTDTAPMAMVTDTAATGGGELTKTDVL